MNAPLKSASRRRFLTHLFSDTPGYTGLSPIEGLHQHTDSVFWAALRISDQEHYVAGDDGLVFRFDGTSWSRENFPSRLPIHSLCAARGNIYSAGWLGQICERTETTWRTVQGGEKNPATVNQPLFEIAADSGDVLWAVGDNGRVVRFDGQTWSELDCGCVANLRAVLPLDDGSVMVAGSGGTVRTLRDGIWQKVETGTGCTIVSMESLGDDTVIAVGGEYNVEEGQFRGRIFLLHDGRWQPVESEHPLPRLRRVRRFGDSLLICGDAGAAFRWGPTGAQRLNTRVRYDLHDLSCNDAGEALVCGDGGTLLQETDTPVRETTAGDESRARWQQISNGETNLTLRGIWGVGDGQLIAAGDGGRVLHIDGESITPHKVPDGLRIHGLWGSSPRHVFAACDNATILHFDGEQWRVAHQGHVETALLAITGFGPHDIFAVGDSGYCLRYDGLMWRQVETGVQQELYALWGQDSQHLLAVGGGGIVLRFNGEQWKTFSAGTDHDLYGVCGSGLNKLFLCGLNGTMIRFEDNAWHRDFTGERSDLHCVLFHDETWFAAGSNGTLLCNSDGTWEAESQDWRHTLQALAATPAGVYAVGSGGIILRR